MDNPTLPPAPVTAPAATTNPPTTQPTAGNPTATPGPVEPTKTPAARTTAALAVTANQPVPNAGAGAIFYLKDGNLLAALPGEKEPRQLAKYVFSYTQAGDNRVVFMQQSSRGTDRVVQLKLINLAGAQPQESLLDTNLFVTLPANRQNEYPAGLYGVDSRAMGSLAVSPDKSQVAYVKANLSGPTFDGMFKAERPTELWLANLDPTNPQPHRLVANAKDYIAQPLWSADNSRIAFIRTDGFGTGAGYQTALWSVFKDGSRLAFLTGPQLGTLDGQPFYASPAYNLRWVGPLALAFQATNQAQDPIFLHDLSQGSDFPAVLVSNSASNAVFCAQAQRYVYLKQDPGQAGQAGAYSVSVANQGQQARALDTTAVELYGCEGNHLLYRTNQGQLILGQLNADGTLSASKSLKLGDNLPDQIIAKLAPGGQVAAVQVGKTTRLLAATGQVTELKSSQFKYETLILNWASEGTLVGLAFTPDQPGQLLAVNISSEQTFKSLDTGKVFSFAEPGQTGKGGL
jgi:hypothetical protein